MFRAHLKALMLALLIPWLMPAGALGAGAVGACSESIRTLGEALEQLRGEGVRTLYTSRLVDASAPVDRISCSGAPEERLRVLLAPMGLRARLAPDGQFVIGRAPSGVLEGTIRSDPGGQVIPLAEVRLWPDGEVTTSDASGRFRLLGVPVGPQDLEISRPGYVDRRVRTQIRSGTRHRLDVSLKLDVEAGDEIFISTTPVEPPLGTWQPGREQLREALAIDRDALVAASRLPGTSPGDGVSFGVRGHEAERLTLVVDGIEIAEPYHFRHLGSLAGAVTPNAIDDLRLHRGSPPVVYGDRAGGVLEVLTDTAGGPFSARLGLGDETAQATLAGNAMEARLRWLTAYRRGEPELPPAGADLQQRPAYWDALAKLTLTLNPSHELTFQGLQVSDDLAVVRQPFYIRALTIHQDSRYSQLSYLGTLGKRHLLDLKISTSELDRRRFGQEQEADILTPPGTNEDFVLDDRRRTDRTTGRADGISNPVETFEWLWGGEVKRETTEYDYLLFAPFLGPQDVEVLETFFHVDELAQKRFGIYSQGTWRPRDGITVSGGLRFDDHDGDDGSSLVPRVHAGFRVGPGVWRLGWSRVRDTSATHELLLADGELSLPGTEVSDYASMGYQIRRGAQNLLVELYHQRIRHPRLRFENLFQSVSRVPELELDRYRVEAEASRSQGVEAHYAYRGDRFGAGATYELSRFEDRLTDGSWQPRRSDRRHAIHLTLTTRLPFDLDANLLWRASSGRRTTPLDLGSASRDLQSALGEINSRRLPDQHQLDLRLFRRWQLRRVIVRAAVGIDNLYDRRNVLGIDLLPLRNTLPPSELPVESSLGRTLRWSLELSW